MLSRAVLGGADAEFAVVACGSWSTAEAATVLAVRAVVAELPPASLLPVSTFVVKPISPMTRIASSNTWSGRMVERSRRRGRLCVRYG